jgi:hypothetical protein
VAKKKELTGKQLALIKEKVENPKISIKAAMRKAGYSNGSIKGSYSSRVTKGISKSLKEAMEKAGLTKEYIAKGLTEGTQANKVQYFAHEGKVLDKRVDPDLSTRRGYYELITTLNGDLVNKSEISGTLSIDLMAIRNEQEAWKKAHGKG